MKVVIATPAFDTSSNWPPVTPETVNWSVGFAVSTSVAARSPRAEDDGLALRDREGVGSDDRGIIDVRERDRGGLRAGGQCPVEDRDAVGRGRFVPVVHELHVPGRELGLGEGRDRHAGVRDELEPPAGDARDRELQGRIEGLGIRGRELGRAQDHRAVFADSEGIRRDHGRVIGGIRGEERRGGGAEQRTIIGHEIDDPRRGGRGVRGIVIGNRA